jgi:2-methylisocitrate lyase-like PEP mutase family enzyme
MQPQASAMQALLNQPTLQVMPGCGDAIGAHLIQEAGFRTGFASGSSISAMRLAMPDMDLLTFPEMRDTVETIIAAAPNVLWLADGDTGYGNAISVQKTIRAYARAGAAAVLIEDKVWPRPLGHQGAKLVIDRDEARLRCRAAVEACHEAGILLLARTDARLSRASTRRCRGSEISWPRAPTSCSSIRRSRRRRCAPRSRRARAGRRSP